MTINGVITAAFKDCHDRLDTHGLPHNIICEECPMHNDCEIEWM